MPILRAGFEFCTPRLEYGGNALDVQSTVQCLVRFVKPVRILFWGQQPPTCRYATGMLGSVSEWRVIRPKANFAELDSGTGLGRGADIGRERQLPCHSPLGPTSGSG